VTATQPAHWRADLYLARSYNIRPIVACAYRRVFIKVMPSNVLRKSVTISRSNERVINAKYYRNIQLHRRPGMGEQI
jgi:hypothetical protein